MVGGKVVAQASPLAVGPRAMLDKISKASEDAGPFINRVAEVAAKRTSGLPSPMDDLRKPNPFKN